MNRAEKAERRATIKRLYAEGASAEELSKQFGLSTAYIYVFAGDGRREKNKSISVLRERAGEVRKLLAKGMTCREAGERFGVSKWVVREFCKENEIQLETNHNSEEDVAQKVRDKTHGYLEYVSGYTNRAEE